MRVKKIKVLVFSGMYPRVGNKMNGIFVHQQLLALKEQNIEVMVVCPVPYTPKILQLLNNKWKDYGLTPPFDKIDGIPIYYPRYIRLPGQWFHGLSSLFLHFNIKQKIKKWIKMFKPDIFHSFGATPNGYVGVKISKKNNLPHICTVVGNDLNLVPYLNRFNYFLTKRVIKNTDAIISVSKALVNKTNTIATPKIIKVIYMGVDFKRFRFDYANRENIRQAINIAIDDIVILYIGNLLKNKGVLDLIDAFNKVTEHFNHIHLIYIGSGPLYNILKDKISEYGLEHRVKMVGYKNHDNIHTWISAADILTLPSYNEGLPNVILEASSCERSIITTNVGGIPEAIIDGVNGLTINPGNLSELTIALNDLISNKSKRNSYGEKGRKMIIENFSWEKNALETIHLYKKLIVDGKEI